MDNHVIDGGANRPRKAAIALEGGHGAGIPNGVLGYFIEFERTHPHCRSGPHGLQSAADNFSGRLHGVELARRAGGNGLGASSKSHGEVGRLLAHSLKGALVDLLNASFSLNGDDGIAVVLDEREGLLAVDT